MQERQQRRRDRWTRLGELGGLFAAVFASVACSMLLVRHTGSPISLWVPNGLVVGALLVVGRRKWPPYLLAAFAAYLLGRMASHGGMVNGQAAADLALDLANVVEILIVATVVRHAFPRIADDTRFLLLGRIALGATLVACAASALLAATIEYAGAGIPFWEAADSWFRSHLLGMVIVASLTLVTLRRRGRVLGERGHRLRMLRDVTVLTAITVGVFAQSRYPLLFAIFAPLLYLVFQHRFPGLVIGITIVALVTCVATAMGRGPLDLIFDASPAEHTLLAQIFLGMLCLVAVPVTLALADRRRLSRRVSESESRYRLLAEYASDLVMRIARDGTRRYVSPSVRDLLGWEVEEYMRPHPEPIHPDDRARVAEAVARLWDTGKPALIQYRLRRRQGEYMWIEALARLAPSPDREGEMELIYTGRDITESMHAEQALAESEQRLRTITDNVPAIIAHIDAEERYTFVNGYVREVTGLDQAAMLGRTVREVRGPELYPLLKPHLDRALAGEPSTFEYGAEYGGRQLYFQTTYLPDTTTHGEPNGIYALTTDITRIKLAEQQLARLAHHDELTGIANRRRFSEDIERAMRDAAQKTLLVMLIDVDRFKAINDTYGHAAGDAVLCEIAQRLKAAVRRTDVLARLGGDEFVALCEDVASPAVAEALAQKVTAVMHAPVSYGDLQLRVTVSVGAALCHGVDAVSTLMFRADEALYRAKERGRACYELTCSGL